jgi:uroporphyrinogen-III decarboxylase
MGPEAYKRFGLPYEQRIFAAVRKAGGIGRLHICGDTSAMVKEMCESGAAIVDLDWQVDLGSARAEADEVDPMIALCGNFDPVSVLYQGTPEQIKAAVRACRDAGGDNWLCAPGCEVPRYTPEENMRAMTEALR